MFKREEGINRRQPKKRITFLLDAYNKTIHSAYTTEMKIQWEQHLDRKKQKCKYLIFSLFAVVLIGNTILQMSNKEHSKHPLVAFLILKCELCKVLVLQSHLE